MTNKDVAGRPLPQTHDLIDPEDRQEVGPSLKQRFSDWIDKRTAKGVHKYGEPLTTENGRGAENDMIEELLDFCQYQEQSRAELMHLLTSEAPIRCDHCPNNQNDCTILVSGSKRVCGICLAKMPLG